MLCEESSSTSELWAEYEWEYGVADKLCAAQEHARNVMTELVAELELARWNGLDVADDVRQALGTALDTFGKAYRAYSEACLRRDASFEAAYEAKYGGRRQ